MKKFYFLAAALLFAVLLTGCSKNNTDTVRVACFPNVTHAQAIYGMATGDFENAVSVATDGKYSLEWYTFNAGPSEIEALLSGSIDIGYIGPVPAVNGYIKSDGGLKIIAGASKAGAALVMRKDLGITDVSGLAGKKVAVPQYGNTQDLVLRDLLASAGLSDTASGGTVEIIQSANADTKVLLENGEADAALVPEPWVSRLINECGAEILVDYDELMGGDYTCAVVIVRKEFLDEHPEIVKAFLEEHSRITNTINENPEEAADVIAKKINELTGTEINSDLILSSFSRMEITTDECRDSVEKFAETYASLGYIPENSDISGIFCEQ